MPAVGDGKFDPSGAITRAEAAKIIDLFTQSMVRNQNRHLLNE
jgi:hypothetical protein